MLELGNQTFFDQDALLDRLSAGVLEAGREVVFVVGAPLTAPMKPETAGVADVQAVTEMIREQFAPTPGQLKKLDLQLSEAPNPYQTAFSFLHGRRGQDAANRIIRRAVSTALKSHKSGQPFPSLANLSEEQLRELDEDTEAWILSPGVAALGELISRYSQTFGRAVVTSNFDPLVGVAIRKFGGVAWRTALYTDGDLSQSEAEGCQVIHIHGYWHGSDTLHTGNQLLQKRPSLKNSLLDFLRDKTVVVMGYGGWQDIFTGSLEIMVTNSTSFPEVIWTFYEKAPTLGNHLKTVLRSGLSRNRVTFYSGIDCHEFLPQLVQQWEELISPQDYDNRASPQQEINSLGQHTTYPKTSLRPMGNLDCDRPPHIEAWVGREAELRSLETSSAKVVAICGIGGQGKSALAAKYLKDVSRGETSYVHWDWRDCKEQRDTIRTQLIAAIERMSDGHLPSADIYQSTDTDLVEVFVGLALDISAVFVFDNVDHYVDLEHSAFVGLLDVLVREFSRSETRCRLIITCRPQISYDLASFITLPMSGLELAEAVELFAQRLGSHDTNEQDIEAAYELTKGHAFWLDLMAVQVSRVPGVTLKKLVEDFRRGRGDTPDVLSSIWETLAEREQKVLRVMAEVVRPETEETIEKFVSTELNYQKFKKALKSLIVLNLIVVKPETNAPDLYDLHPLVRQFVRKRFEKRERTGFIQTVLSQYIVIIHGIGDMLGVHLPFALLVRWSQKAELEIEAGLYEDAFNTLSEAEEALLGGGHIEEYVRVARKLFETVNWETAPTKFKQFDQVISAMISCLDQLEEIADADDLLRRYEETVPHKTARYIKYCDVKCHSYWTRGKFEEAQEWGARGVNLKSASDVDTHFDCKHNLALAKRDGGDPKGALEYFVEPFDLTDLTDPDSTIASEKGSTLGNVGRCLQMMGELQSALVCFRKSALALENDSSRYRASNQAYARQWIAETFANLGKRDMAINFYLGAEDLLLKSAPARARAVRLEIDKLLPMEDSSKFSSTSANRLIETWIHGQVALL